ncbi:MAG: ATP-binding protein [Actinobacteria bacterium]|nr:ATP-binding protein [Actinomycetota bacterium]
MTVGSQPVVIGLIGGECSGKTTLARALVEELHGIHVREKLRDFVDEVGRPPRDDEQAPLMRDQEAAEDAAIRESVTTGKSFVVCDPAAFMTAIYSIAYFNDASLLQPGIDRLAAYDALIWCDATIPWEADGGQRDGPHERDRVDAIIAATLADHGIVSLHVAGTVAERVRQIRGSIVR